jgi:basic membrane lipoprotein Med (substrate-binding protein (PBP1-ABC) superfamily)
LNDSKAESDRPIADTPNGFIQTYNSAVGNQGYKTLVLPGSLHANPLQQFSRQQKDTFDKAGYIFLDYDVGTPSDAPGRFTEDGVEHVASVLFRAEQAAFLAAISTCQYLNENFDQYYSPNKPLAIGTFGGNPIISVVSYMGGFELGAYLYNQMVTHEYQKFNYYGDGQPYNNDPTDVKHYYKNHLVNFINLGKPAS